MREYKFRAWDTINHRMYEDIKPLSNTGIGIPHFDSPEDRPDESNYEEWNYIWMQTTGLKDRKEKEIYEGDICRLIGSKYSFIVIYETMYASFRLKSILSEAGYGFEYIEQKIVVVGNVHENPELLK